MRTALLGGAAVIGFIAFMAATDIGGLLYQKATAPLRGQSEAERQIESGASRIQRYQEFFNICQGIQAKEDAIDNLQANSSMDTQKRDTAITANQNARATLIAEYNSKSGQAYTAARFKASNLPYQINRGPYMGSNRTNCVTQ
jgi:hypothetical protein